MKVFHLFLVEKENHLHSEAEVLSVLSAYRQRCVDQQASHYSSCQQMWPQLEKVALILADSNTQEGLATVLPWTDYSDFKEQFDAGKIASESLVSMDTCLRCDFKEQFDARKIASESVSESLHQLADTLPDFGVQVHVIWIRDLAWKPLTESLEVFGALKKLSCWYNAHIRLVPWADSSGDQPTAVQALNAGVKTENKNTGITENEQLTINSETVDIKQELPDVPMSEIGDKTESINGNLSKLENGNQSTSRNENQCNSRNDNQTDSAQVDQLGALPWARVLCAEVVGSRGELVRGCGVPLWTGHVKMMPSETEEPVILPGFVLKPHHPQFPAVSYRKAQTQESCERIYSRYMAFIAMVDVRDMPPFYVTDTTYQVCVSCEGHRAERSKQFLQMLVDQPHAGCLVQISHGSSWRHIQKAKSLLKKPHLVGKDEEKTWFDDVVDNPHELGATSRPVQLCGDLGVEKYLLMKETSAGGDRVITARLMRKPRDLNGAVAGALRQLQGCPEVTETKENSADLLSSVPCYEASDWLKLEAEIQQAQIQALDQWAVHVKDQTGQESLNVSDIIRISTGVRSKYMEQYRAEHGDLPQVTPEQNLELVAQEPEHENPGKQLERLILKYSVSQQAAALQSNDSIGGLSPPCKGQVVKLNEAEFLKHFHLDSGLSKKTKLTRLHTKKSKRSKYTEDELKETEWPHCSHFHYHDIYYNVGQTPEKREDKSGRYMTWIRRAETLSTCTDGQKNKTQHIIVKDAVVDTPGKGGKSKTTETGSDRKPATSRKRSLNSFTPPPPAKSRRRTIAVDTPPRAAATATSVKRRRSVNTPPSIKKPGLLKTGQASTAVNMKEESSEKTAAEKVTTVAKSENVDAKTLSDKKAAAKSRSERHKMKLEAACVKALESQGVTKSDDRQFFKSCFTKLYTMSYTFVKDLRSYESLTKEMEKITMMQAPTIIYCERASKK